MFCHLYIYVDFANDAGVRYFAPINLKDGKVGGFDQRDNSAGYAHNTTEDWNEAERIFGEVVDFYREAVKDLVPFASDDESYIRSEVADEGLCSISLDAPDDSEYKFPNCSVFGEILFEAEKDEFPNPVVFSF